VIKMDAILWKDLLSLRRNKGNMALLLVAGIFMSLSLMWGFAVLKPGLLPFISLLSGTVISGIFQEPTSLQDGSFEALLATHLSPKKIIFKRVMFSSFVGWLLALMTVSISWFILRIINHEVEILWCEVTLSILLSLLLTIGAVGMIRAELFTIATHRFFKWMIPLLWPTTLVLLVLSFFFKEILLAIWILCVFYLVIFSLLIRFGKGNKESIIQ